MTKRQEQLSDRGFIAAGIESNFKNILLDEKVRLLKSITPTERTLGARLLKDNKAEKTVEDLIHALKIEKKLYPKIEICNSLSEMDEFAIQPLILCLGKIGNNQHKVVPEKEFFKNSYPLPRDIAGRTLIRIGKKAMPELLKELKTEDKRILSELIDTIGHIHFNSKLDNIYEPLKSCYKQHEKEDLIKWKIIRAFSGVNESELFLTELQDSINIDRLQKEINRSLRLIKNHKSNAI
jgi:hypothetical protein